MILDLIIFSKDGLNIKEKKILICKYDDFFYKNVVKAINIILNITQNCDKCLI